MTHKVLVVDDSPLAAQLLTQALADAGFATDTAANPGELDTHVAHNTYDLILLDLDLGSARGDELVGYLRDKRKVKSKLFLYSDTAEPALAETAARVSADGFLAKARGLEVAVETVREAVMTTDEMAAPKKRVLVVDDSHATVQLLEAGLAAQGYEVLTAPSAEEATKIILKKKSRPDMVLLDVNMPGVNGAEFCRFIKSNSVFSGIQVVLCSAKDESELKELVESCGADGYVQKETIAREILEMLS